MDADHVRKLVQRLLDEFEEKPLGASARRAFRIARLLGDVAVAHRLQLQLRTSMTLEERTEGVAELYPEMTEAQVREYGNAQAEGFLESRIPRRLRGSGGNAQVLQFGSVDQLVAAYDLLVESMATAMELRQFNVLSQVQEAIADRREVLDGIRAFIFDYAVRTEAQLEVSDSVSQTLGRHRQQVDALLESIAPELRDKLQAALRTARDIGDDEARSQVLTTCRRVIIAVADHLYPPSHQPFISATGPRVVGAGNYRNRILAGVEVADTSGGAFAAALSDLAIRP